MQDPRAQAAMDRIERALSRIEAAVAVDPKPPVEAEELKKLRAAHALLRSRVEGAIGEIDAMIGPGER